MLYTKGIEEELFIGTQSGTGISFSEDIQKHVRGFVREIDGRQTEYGTEPCRHYLCILKQMLDARRRLRDFLSIRGSFSIIPGGTLPFDPEHSVCATDSEDAYYRYLLGKFGARAVTTGSHLNIGIEDPDFLMRLCRVIRMEAPLFIALTASSPFLAGRITGYRSNRWLNFPQEPFPVPFFENHKHYIEWTEERLRLTEMKNVRHLWTSVRPNGDRRPYDLNRLELRVCDSNPDPRITLAALALLESRAHYLVSHAEVDVQSLPPQYLKPEAVHDRELAACRGGLDAEVMRWDTGRTCRVGHWIEDLLKQASAELLPPSLQEALRPIENILAEGSRADRWLEDLESGLSLSEVVSRSIAKMEQMEQAIERELSSTHPLPLCPRHSQHTRHMPRPEALIQEECFVQ